jgi:phospholipase/carboxylesterase
MESSPDPATADALAGLLQPLLKAYEVLFLVARHFHPPRFEQVMAQIGTPDEDLKSASAQYAGALSELEGINQALGAATGAARNAFAALRDAQAGAGDVRDIFRAFRFVPEGLEALYALASVLPPVNRFFLEPSLRSDEALQALYIRPPTQEQVGIMHFATSEDDDGERGGFWLYVPEHYTPDRNWPLVMALHGGSGTGHQFLWSWLRDARSRGAILVAPSSLGPTWALSGEDEDTPNLHRMLDFIRSNWSVDPARMLLTGMSDGGTFTYVSGLQEAAPFTHLAPISAAFHPLLFAMIDATRLSNLPVHITHGALDWMFPVTMAREAASTLKAAGADVTLRELADLSHTYPREINAELLDWLAGAPSPKSQPTDTSP